MCRHCFRGHIYCPWPCRRAARGEVVARARAGYEASKKGLATHRVRQSRYRQNRRRVKKSVTDPTSNPVGACATVPGDEPQADVTQAPEASATSAAQAGELGTARTQRVGLRRRGRCCQCGQQGWVVFRVVPGVSRQRGGWLDLPT